MAAPSPQMARIERNAYRDSWSDGLVDAFLGVALFVVGLHLVMQSPRMLAYAGVLAVGGAVAAVADSNPGWPLLAAGVVVLAEASRLVTRLLRLPSRPV